MNTELLKAQVNEISQEVNAILSILNKVSNYSNDTDLQITTEQSTRIVSSCNTHIQALKTKADSLQTI